MIGETYKKNTPSLNSVNIFLTAVNDTCELHFIFQSNGEVFSMNESQKNALKISLTAKIKDWIESEQTM